MNVFPILGVIPARGGSKGLPGKNIRILAGLPLIAHSIRCAAMSRVLDRCIVSTDSEEIAGVARAHGGDVPFLRPAELATDSVGMVPVLKHALSEMERREGRRFESLLLLDPTSPGRVPSDIEAVVTMLDGDPSADGVVGVSRPEFNPYWHCVVEEKGFMRPLMPEATRFVRRQDLPPVFRINGAVYLWRRDFLMGIEESWLLGRIRAYELPEAQSVTIDDADEFARTDLMVRHGLIRFPWLEE